MSQKIIHKPAISAIVLLALFSCKPGTAPRQDVEPKDSADYTSLFLPDTAYASAEAVKYSIDESDSTAHHLLNLDDYYSGEGVYAFRKNALRDAVREGTMEKVTAKPVLPGEEEIAGNTRARSAKLRVAARTMKGK